MARFRYRQECARDCAPVIDTSRSRPAGTRRTISRIYLGPACRGRADLTRRLLISDKIKIGDIVGQHKHSGGFDERKALRNDAHDNGLTAPELRKAIVAE